MRITLRFGRYRTDCRTPLLQGAGQAADPLPAAEKDTLLTMLASGQATQAQALLLRRFRDTAATADHSASARGAAELLEAADARMLERNAPRRNAAGNSKDTGPLPRPRRTPSVSMTSRPRERRPGTGRRDDPAIGHPGAVPGRRRTRRGDARRACHAVGAGTGGWVGDEPIPIASRRRTRTSAPAAG
jgi:hypothetical protein